MTIQLSGLPSSSGDTLTPSNHQPPERNRGIKNPRGKLLNPLNTARPMPPSAETPSASTTAKECWGTPTHQSTPWPPHAMNPPRSSEKMLPLPPNSSNNLMTNKPATSRSRPPTHWSSTFPIPPLHLSKRSSHHLCSVYALPPTVSATTPQFPPDQWKPSST